MFVSICVSQRVRLHESMCLSLCPHLGVCACTFLCVCVCVCVYLCVCFGACASTFTFKVLYKHPFLCHDIETFFMVLNHRYCGHYFSIDHLQSCHRKKQDRARRESKNRRGRKTNEKREQKKETEGKEL